MLVRNIIYYYIIPMECYGLLVMLKNSHYFFPYRGFRLGSCSIFYVRLKGHETAIFFKITLFKLHHTDRKNQLVICTFQVWFLLYTFVFRSDKHYTKFISINKDAKSLINNYFLQLVFPIRFDISRSCLRDTTNTLNDA